MKTECPHCHTLFRVSDQQIQNAGGQVRCGHCLAIFTAELPRQMSFDDLLDDAAADAWAGAEDFSNHALKPVTEFVTSGTQADAQDAVVDLDEFADVSPTSRQSNANNPALPDVIPPALRAESRNGKKRFGFLQDIFWIFAALIFIVLGLAQYAWYERLQLLQHTQTRPWFELACQYLHCELPEPQDLSFIELTRKNIYSHPNDKQSLMVSGSMINQAEFSQPFPLLELRFENVRGETIAARRFKPDEYLDLPADQIAKMKPGIAVAFSLEISDPGVDIVSYEFKFF